MLHPDFTPFTDILPETQARTGAMTYTMAPENNTIKPCNMTTHLPAETRYFERHFRAPWNKAPKSTLAKIIPTYGYAPSRPLRCR